MVETMWRPIRPSRLTDAQRQAYVQKSSEYEIAVQNLSASFYHKKRTTAVTAEEEERYRQDKAKLWNDYLEWAKANGLYEEVTLEQQLTEAEESLGTQVEQVNQIRTELGKKPIQIIEKSVEVR